MYNGYSSFDNEIQRHSLCHSPLSSPIASAVAEKVTRPYVEYINEFIGSNRNVPISTDKDFKWALEIFSFGLTCEDSSIYQSCVNIYVEWLKVFEPKSNPLPSIPLVLYEKRELYWSQMLWHLYQLFVVHDGKSLSCYENRRKLFFLTDVYRSKR